MREKQRKSKIVLKQNFIWIGIAVGIVYWFIESWIDVQFFYATSYADALLSPTPHELWKRLLVITLLVLFSAYSQYSINIRRRTEATLQERERELTLMLENNPAGTMLVDTTTRRISWSNTNALKMIGTTKEDITGRICHDHLCPNEPGSCPVLDKGQEIDISERQLLTVSGDQIPILKSVTRVKYDGRDHLLETFFDLSDRKKMERDVELAHAELNQIFQTASVGMRVVDRDCNVLKINRTFEVMTGITEAEASGRKCYEVFAGPKCFTPNCPLKLIMDGRQVVECFVDKKRTDGAIIPCILTAKRFESPRGEFVGIVESFQDISELKKAQDATQSERDKMHRILSCLKEGVSIFNPHFVVEYQSAILKDYFGECDSKPCYSVFHQLDQPCENCLMKVAMESGQIQQCELSCSNGRLLEQVYTPVKDFDGSAKVIVLFRDITDEKASLAAVMQAKQLASLGEMAAGIAHEINNPINGIINYGQILINKSEKGSKTNDISTRIVKEGDRIARIVEGLLSFSRQKKEEKTPVAITKIISEALTLTESQIRRDKIVLKKNIPSNLPEIIGQPNEIEQVFVNIISNARDALNQQYPGSSPKKILEVNAEEVKSNDQKHIRVSFHDRGIGIPKNIADKVMNPFFSTKADAKFSGTGLGLSISLGIIEEHRGRLTIESREGKYTTVAVELPIWAGKKVGG